MTILQPILRSPLEPGVGGRGPELVADPSFNSPAAWTPESAAWVVSGGKATYTAGGALAYLQSVTGFTLEAGKTYEVRFTVSGIASGSMVYSLFNSTATVNLLGSYQEITTNGDKVITFVPPSTVTGIRIYGNNGGTAPSWSMESLSIRRF